MSAAPDDTAAGAPRDGAPATRWTAAPDGWLAAFILAILGAAGVFYVNIMPALVDGLIGSLGFDARQAGLVSAANVYGAAAGGLTAALIVGRVGWRRAATAALLAMIAIDLASGGLRELATLVAVRLAHGFAGGLLTGMAFAVYARTRSPDRVFGALLTVQYGLGGIGLIALPRLVPEFGTPALFGALIAMSVLALALLPLLAPYPPRAEADAGAATRAAGTRWLPLGLTLLAVFLFQVANMAVSAFVIGLGRQAGLATAAISSTLGVANWIGVLGSVLVLAVGLRFGRGRPLGLGMVVTIAGTWAFAFADRPGLYFAANAVTSVTWAFMIPYLLGMCATFDRTGRSAALGGFCSKMGLASGPLLGGMLLARMGYDELVYAGIAGLVLCTAAFLPALVASRRAAAATTATAAR